MSNKVIALGELMIRLSPDDNKRFGQAQNFQAHFGGSEANVACALAQWNIASSFVSSLPNNDLGQNAVRFLRTHNVNTTYVLFSENRLGLYFVEKGTALRAGNVIYDRENSCIANAKPEDFDWDELLDGAEWFHWSGITPAISQNAALICQNAIKTASKKGLIISADFNYRSKLWQYGKQPRQVMPELLEYCDVVLGDIDTAATYLDIFPEKDEDALVSVSRQLMKRLPQLKTLAMTFREVYSATHNSYHGVLNNGQQMYTSQKHDINPITERIGTGDAFMAGLIFGIMTRKSPQDTIEFAAAAGALKHTIEGDILLARANEVEKLSKEGFSGKINR